MRRWCNSATLEVSATDGWPLNSCTSPVANGTRMPQCLSIFRLFVKRAEAMELIYSILETSSLFFLKCLIEVITFARSLACGRATEYRANEILGYGSGRSHATLVTYIKHSTLLPASLTFTPALSDLIDLGNFCLNSVRIAVRSFSYHETVNRNPYV